jgi:dihydrofolate reductase
MRKLALQMMTSLNGRVDDPDAWVSGVSDDLYADIDRLYDGYDTVLVGHTTYEEMAAYWPGAETEEGGTETNRRMAHRMNTYRKYVLSRTGEPGPLPWSNAELVRVDDDNALVAFIEGLKQQPGRDIHISGGASLARSVVRLGLVDDYHLFVYPNLTGGQAWFADIADSRGLRLVSATTYRDGVLGLTYEASHGEVPVPVERASFTDFLDR